GVPQLELPLAAGVGQVVVVAQFGDGPERRAVGEVVPEGLGDGHRPVGHGGGPPEPFGGEKAVEGTLLREGLVKAPNLVPMAVALAAQLQAPRTPVTPAGVVGEGRGAQGRPLREALPLTVPDGLLEAPV